MKCRVKVSVRVRVKVRDRIRVRVRVKVRASNTCSHNDDLMNHDVSKALDTAPSWLGCTVKG